MTQLQRFQSEIEIPASFLISQVPTSQIVHFFSQLLDFSNFFRQPKDSDQKY